jgi:CRISPR-associated endoribonuclease Cas6
MRTLVTLNAKQEQSYQPEYHHKLRGLVWDCLSDTEHSEMHGRRDTVPFVYSNPFPVKNMDEGDECRFIISSPHYELIDDLADRIRSRSEMSIGEMSFDVDSVSTFGVDVGEPGREGILRTATGVYIPIWENEWNDYDIDVPYNTDQIGWTQEYDNNIFFDKICQNVSWKQDKMYAEYLKSPKPYDLFDGVSRNKTYSVTTKVSSDNGGYEYTFVVSKWDLKYRVTDEDHRRWLNILLESGIGWRNSLGFGFLNKVIEE